MRKALFATFGLLLALGASANVPESVVVLLPDADGGVGKLEVSHDKGNRLLHQPHHAAALHDEHGPGEARVLKPKHVEEHFGETISAQPPAAKTFILYFQRYDPRLTAESEKQLPEILAEIGRRAAPDVDVVGHTDTSGDRDYNAVLVEWRTESVRDAVVAIGVEPAHILVSSHGETNPLVPTADGVAEPKNRRVDVTVR